MKKRFLGLALVLTAFAANAQTDTDQVALNVKLYPIQTIVVNAANVDLEYKTKDDYKDGVQTDQPNHLTVYSTGGFTVSVKSEFATLTNTINSEKIESEDIKISAAEGTSDPLTGAIYKSGVKLSTTAAELIKSTTGGVNKTFNVKYEARGTANNYVNKYFNAQNPTVYTTNVIYEIVAS